MIGGLTVKVPRRKKMDRGAAKNAEEGAGLMDMHSCKCCCGVEGTELMYEALLLW
ncbi:hypothetical protein Syun_014603 [Stephania yunnanensis]|uniref:Uncharacterized protein n=1 Tax=Stephania yunnanensis TaxID=152371 RepID=A0AAP0JLD8_9MAGN